MVHVQKNNISLVPCPESPWKYHLYLLHLYCIVDKVYHACILVIGEEYWILRFKWTDSVSVERSKVMLNLGMTGTGWNRQNQADNAGSLMKWRDAARCWQCLWSVYRIWYCGWVWHPSNRAAVDRISASHIILTADRSSSWTFRTF